MMNHSIHIPMKNICHAHTSLLMLENCIQLTKLHSINNACPNVRKTFHPAQEMHPRQGSLPSPWHTIQRLCKTNNQSWSQGAIPENICEEEEMNGTEEGGIEQQRRGGERTVGFEDCAMLENMLNKQRKSKMKAMGTEQCLKSWRYQSHLWKC